MRSFTAHRHRSPVRGAILWIAVAWLLAEAPALAGGFTITSIGGRRASSLVNLARPDDTTALFHNPAGLADLSSMHFHLSNAFYLMRTDFRMKALDPRYYPEVNPANCDDGGANPCPWPVDDEGYYTRSIKPERFFGTIPYLGMSVDLETLGLRVHDVTVAAALYAPGFYSASLPADAPTSYQVIDGMFLVGSAAFGAGWRINPMVSVGASLSYNYMRISSSRRVSPTQILTPVGQEPSTQAILAQKALGDFRLSYAGTDSGMSWVAGVLLSPTGWLNVGLSYWGSTRAEIEGPVHLTADGPIDLKSALKTFGYKLPKRLQVEMPIPHSLLAGVSLSPWSWLEVGVDLRTWLYQLYEKNRMTPIYDPAEPGEEPMTEEALSQSMGYNLSYELACGVLVRPFRRVPGLELMAGVSFDKSPIPDRTFTMENPSLSSWNYTGGVRFAVSPHWRLTLSYLQYNYVRRSIRNSLASPPTNGEGTGTAYLPAFEVEYVL